MSRGWVPRAKLDPVKRIDGQIQGNIDIIGWSKQKKGYMVYFMVERGKGGTPTKIKKSMAEFNEFEPRC